MESVNLQESFGYPSPMLSCLALTPLNAISDGSNNALSMSPVTSSDAPDLPTEPRPLARLLGTASSALINQTQFLAPRPVLQPWRS